MKKAFINAVCLVIAVLSGILLFILKYQVKEEEKLLKTIHREILQNKREIHILEAEWAHLNDPQRLLELVKSQTHWETISAAQISMLSDIPLRPEVLPAAPEVIETEKEAPAAVEKKVVQEVVQIKSAPVVESKPAPAEKAPAEKAPAKPAARGAVQNGVWKPANNVALKAPATAKPKPKPSPAKGVSKPIVKKTPDTSELIKKGSSALSSLLSKGSKQ